ncbi:MAG TPA: hypothetical protein VMI11_00135 [Actinomycetes bacterium]|nr:hypothetical protein [Actinomycetes bacterium]
MRTVAPRASRRCSLTLLFGVLTVLGVLLQPLGVPGALASPKPPVPAPITLPAAIEPLPTYQPPVACDPVAKAGPKRLEALLAATYGSTAFGITRPCSGTPTSEHQEGRALDWMLAAPTTKADINAFLSWLLAKDAQGHAVAMARRMGIMYVIWQNRMFRVYQPSAGWQPYLDCAKHPQAAYDTTCHRDHAHFSFTWDGARARTSYWSGRAVTVPDCPEATGQPVATTVSAKGLQFLPLPATTLLDTRTGKDACRLSQDEYVGEGRRLDVTVAGVGGVPAGAKAVLLRVYATSPNASGDLRVQPAGAPSWASDALTLTAGVTGTNVITVPVGAGGAVSLTLSTGQAAIAVEVLGAFVPADATLLHPVVPSTVLEATVQPSSVTPLSRAQLGVPADASAVALSVAVSGGSVAGGVRVYGAHDPLPAAAMAAPTATTGRTATAADVVALGPGLPDDPAVLVRSASGTRAVQVVLTGWYAPASVAGGALFTAVKPATLVNSASGVGLKAALAAGRSATLRLIGHGVPSAAVAVVAQARLASSARTQAVVWPAGTEPDAWVLAAEAKRVTTTQLTTALSSAGAARMAADAGATAVRLVAVGAWVPAAG